MRYFILILVLLAGCTETRGPRPVKKAYYLMEEVSIYVVREDMQEPIVLNIGKGTVLWLDRDIERISEIITASYFIKE